MNNPTPDQIEAESAQRVALLLQRLHGNEAAIGIIWKAFDLLTADLSTARKRALILGDKTE